MTTPNSQTQTPPAEAKKRPEPALAPVAGSAYGFELNEYEMRAFALIEGASEPAKDRLLLSLIMRHHSGGGPGKAYDASQLLWWENRIARHPIMQSLDGPNI